MKPSKWNAVKLRKWAADAGIPFPKHYYVFALERIDDGNYHVWTILGDHDYMDKLAAAVRRAGGWAKVNTHVFKGTRTSVVEIDMGGTRQDVNEQSQMEMFK